MIRKEYSELTFTDDFMFCKVLTANPDLCHRLLELILDVRIAKIALPESQKSVDPAYRGHGVRFDVYVEDDIGTVYDIEMQVVLTPGLAKRLRHYQGMIDVEALKSGEDYA